MNEEVFSSEEGKLFAREYQKYWNHQPNIFSPTYKQPYQQEINMLKYIQKHNLPIILYDNYIDREQSVDDVIEYFKDIQKDKDVYAKDNVVSVKVSAVDLDI